jgi:hypothetical protein
MSDPHVMGEGQAPTPFTAAEIRAGCPDGHTLRVRTTSAGGSSEVTHRFDDGDGDGVTITYSAGAVAESARVSWHDLQAHASFPAGSTTITTESIDTELGILECLRYDVQRDAVATFWFAPAHPGMPVRYTDGSTVTDVVGIERT